MKVRMHNNSDVFEKQGNPWGGSPKRREPLPPITETEARIEQVMRKHGLKSKQPPRVGNLIEDPDMDRYTKATRAKPHFETGPQVRTPIGDDDRRRLAAILLRLKNKTRRTKLVTIEQGELKQEDLISYKETGEE